MEEAIAYTVLLLSANTSIILNQKTSNPVTIKIFTFFFKQIAYKTVPNLTSKLVLL